MNPTDSKLPLAGTITIPIGRYKELSQHSEMLSQIAGYIEPYCISEDCTTLDAVRLIIARFQKLQSEKEIEEIHKKYEVGE